MKMLRDHWPIAVLVLVALIFLGASIRATRWKGVADAEHADAERQAEVLDKQHAALELARERRARDSVAIAAARDREKAQHDSLLDVRDDLEAEKAVNDRERELADSARLPLRRAVLAQAVSGSVRPKTARAFVAATDRALAVADSATSIESRRADAEAARADLAEAGEARERSAAELLRVDLRDQGLFSDRQKELLDTKDREISALRRAVAPSFLDRAKDDLATIGAACTAAAGMARQDRMVVAGGCLAGALIVEAIR